MKIFIGLFAFLSFSVQAFAGGVFYNSNQSAEYFRTFARNAATDNADIVYYNMSGTTKMKDGLYVNVSNQTMFQKATVETKNNPVTGDKKYTSDNIVWADPNAYVLFKKERWAVFFGFETIGATAVREWNDGLPTFDMLGKINFASAYNAQLAALGYPSSAFVSPAQCYSSSYVKGSSEYFALRLGGAYAVSELFSFALCGRMVYAKQKVQASINAGLTEASATKIADIDYTDKAAGFSGEANFDLFPVKGMTVAFTYEMATPLEFKRSVNGEKNGGGLIADGEKKNLDLPQVFRCGISYNITDALRTEAAMNIYFEKYADLSRLDDSTAGIDSGKSYGNTYEYAFALEYTFSKMFLASSGINYVRIGQEKSATLDISTPGAHADYIGLGIGGQVSPADNFKINLSLAYIGFIKKYWYADAYDRQVAALSGSPASKEYNKNYVNVGLGAEYRL